MGIHYQWADDARNIMLVTMEAPWTVAEYDEGMSADLNTVRGVDHRCATITDIRKMGAIPMDGNILPVMLRMETIAPPNLFVSVVVGVSYSASVFLGMTTRLRPRAHALLRYVETMEQAYEVIASRQQELSL